ncbi:MAG: hypothetical protein MJY78_06945 [Fibrobacter sp.]|nr:hypothetical protein [Fibrobacter sp.]
MFKIVYTFCFVGLVAMIAACGNGPISANEADELVDGVRAEESRDRNYDDDYRRSSSSYSYYDDYYRSSSSYYDYYSSSSSSYYDYYSSSSSSFYDYYSSSSSKTSIYTEGSTTLTITLDYYHQLKSMDADGKKDGDPRISFTVKTYRNSVRYDSLKTSTISLGNDVGTWSGSKSVSAVLRAGINKIYICPNFVDADAIFDDYEYDSNTCYIINDAGLYVGERKDQNDYKATYYELEWHLVYTINYD